MTASTPALTGTYGFVHRGWVRASRLSFSPTYQSNGQLCDYSRQFRLLMHLQRHNLRMGILAMSRGTFVYRNGELVEKYGPSDVRPALDGCTILALTAHGFAL